LLPETRAQAARSSLGRRWLARNPCLERMDGPDTSASDPRADSTPQNNRQGTFTDATRSAASKLRVWKGVAWATTTTMVFTQTFFITCGGRAGFSQHRPKELSLMPRVRAGLVGRQGFSNFRAWIDFDRDGLMDLFICNLRAMVPRARGLLTGLDGSHKFY